LRVGLPDAPIETRFWDFSSSRRVACFVFFLFSVDRLTDIFRRHPVVILSKPPKRRTPPAA
jgi:hypothetical protein